MWHGQTVMMQTARDLKFGTDLQSYKSLDTIIIPATEYLVIIPGYEGHSSSSSSSTLLSTDIDQLFDSWSLDMEKKTPQFISNKYLLF